MRTLFWKIFAWFFLSSALIVVISAGVFAAVRAAEARNRPPRFRIESRALAPLLRVAAHTAASLAAQGKTEELDAFLATFEREAGARAFLFDLEGYQLTQREVPDALPDLVTDALFLERVVFEPRESGSLVAYAATPPGDGPTLIFAAELPPRPSPGPSFDAPFGVRDSLIRLLFPPGQFPVRLVVFLVGAGVFCYALASYLTAPVRRLQTATRQLADGDLTTRVTPQMGRRRDELADLGRDFDAMAERIETLLASQRRLLGDISHELRSPLARMQVALDLAEDDLRDGHTEAVQSQLVRIRHESERLNDMIGQLLTITRLESGQIQTNREKVDVGRVVEEVAADASFEAKSHNRNVVVTQSESCSVVGDARLLQSAIENVIRNAARYTPESTSVEISLNCESDAALIRVRDHGSGVPEEALEDLFRPFYRVEGARDRSSGGVGLGLAITQRAVSLHGGSVQAFNHPEGGLLVEIRLPI